MYLYALRRMYLLATEGGNSTMTFQRAADQILDERIELLRVLRFEAASALPEADQTEVVVGDVRCGLCVFRQSALAGLPGSVLVTVQISRRHALGFFQTHVEKGLVFSPDGSVREASQAELLDSGG